MAVRPTFNLPTNQYPDQGPMGILCNLGFSTLASQVISDDLGLEQQTGVFEGPQAAWIDNRLNAQAVAVTFLGLNFTLQVRAGRQGIYPIITAAGICRWSARSPQILVDVPMILINQPMSYWFQDA